jgi:hypothetical protein
MGVSGFWTPTRRLVARASATEADLRRGAILIVFILVQPSKAANRARFL